jgi:hypothetical protein
VCIFDLAGVRPPRAVAIQLFKLFQVMDSQCYPEMLHKAFIVNSSWLFKRIWSMLSVFVDPVTRSKVRCDDCVSAAAVVVVVAAVVVVVVVGRHRVYRLCTSCRTSPATRAHFASPLAFPSVTMPRPHPTRFHHCHRPQSAAPLGVNVHSAVAHCGIDHCGIPLRRRQVNILGGLSDFKDALLEVIPTDNLPVEYGGTCTCNSTSEPGIPPSSSCLPPLEPMTMDEKRAMLGFQSFSMRAGAGGPVLGP